MKKQTENEKVNKSTVKPTEKFREEGVGRDPFSKGVSPDGLNRRLCRNGLSIISPPLFHR